MKEIGTVERIDKGFLWVRVNRKSACGENCATCKGGCVPTERTVCVKNTKKCRVGDKIILELETKKVMGAAFLVYILPLLSLVLGYFLGEYFFKSEGKAIITGVILMALSFIPLRVFDKKSKDKYIAEICGIIEKNPDDL